MLQLGLIRYALVGSVYKMGPLQGPPTLTVNVRPNCSAGWICMCRRLVGPWGACQNRPRTKWNTGSMFETRTVKRLRLPLWKTLNWLYWLQWSRLIYKRDTGINVTRSPPRARASVTGARDIQPRRLDKAGIRKWNLVQGVYLGIVYMCFLFNSSKPLTELEHDCIQLDKQEQGQT